MSNLSLKMWNFKVDFRGGNQLKIMVVTRDLSSGRKWRKFFIFFLNFFLNLRPDERYFLTIFIFSWFPLRKLALKFQIFKLKLLITFDVIVIDNFWCQIWNQRILLVNILENEENRRTLLITIHPPTHPDNKGFWGFKKGRSSFVFLKAPFSFLIHILNWKDCQVDPIGFAPHLPSGDKGFRDMKKGGYTSCFWKPKYGVRSSMQIK